MRHLLLSLSCLFGIVSGGYSQTELSPFLFDTYQDAIVYMRNGMEIRGKMNYHLPSEKFYFIDEQYGNQAKILSNADEVNIIKFGARVFYPEQDGGVEILSSEPSFYVQYKVTVRDKPKSVGYGGTSSLGNVKTYSSNSTGFSPDAPVKLEVGSRYNVYWVEKKGKKKEVRNMKQFLKLNSTHKEELEKYIKENNVCFDDAQQMLKLCIYADSLLK